MGNVIGEPIERYVANQINVRQKLQGSGVDSKRTDTQLSLLTSNTSWVKLGSGVSIDKKRLTDIGLNSKYSEGMALAKDNILFGGTSGLNKNNQTIQRDGFLPREANSSYTYDSSFGFSPMAGIESADIKTLNRGSLKKATVKLKANDRSQFDIIDVLYMRLGYTVLLEWGNAFFTEDGISKTIIHNTLMEKKFFTNSERNSPFDFLEDIENERETHSGNYDALFGKVSNFSWSFNPDGTYDIELTIISLGDVIESLKSNISPSKSLKEFVQKLTTTSQIPPEDALPDSPSIIESNKDSDIISSMLFLWKFLNPLNRTGGKEVKIITTKPATHIVGELLQNFQNGSSDENNIVANTRTYIFTTTYNLITTEKYTVSENQSTFMIPGSSTTNMIDVEKTRKISTPTTEISPPQEFLTDNAQELIETYIQNQKTKYKDPDTYKNVKVKYKRISKAEFSIDNPIEDAEDKDAFKLKTTTPEYYLRFGYLLEYISTRIVPKIKNGKKHEDNPKMFDIDFESYYNYMYSLPNQISLDPKVCIVKNQKFITSGGEIKVFDGLALFKEKDNGVSQNENSAYPMNIYLNFNFILDCLKTDDRGNVSIFEFLSNICTGLNKALGGINNLEPVIDETKNILKIIDTTPIPGHSGGKPITDYTLQLWGYDKNQEKYTSNFLRNLNIQTTITPEYATMITVGATAGGYVKGTEATAFSRWNVGLRDRYKEDFEPGDISSIKSETPGSVDEAEFNYVNSFLSGTNYNSRYGLNIIDPSKNMKLVDDIISNNISIGTEYYRYLLSKNKEKSGGTIGFIPFKISFTMDGISGIKIYNKLHVNTEFLPKAYGDNVDLIVTGVSHKLSNNDWETDIEATVMPKTEQFNTLGIDSTNIVQESITNVVNNSGNVTRTWKSPTRNKIIQAFGWPIEVTQTGDQYFGTIIGKDEKGRNLYKTSSTYKSKWFTPFEYKDKNGKVRVKGNFHTQMHDPLRKSLQKIEAAGFIDGIINLSGGIYARDTTGSENVGILSGHSFGVALDFNSDIYQRGNPAYNQWYADVTNSNYQGVLPNPKHFKAAKAIQIMKNMGLWEWGGNYNGTKDTHHFTFKPFST